jgi:hypothetical protein
VVETCEFCGAEPRHAYPYVHNGTVQGMGKLTCTPCHDLIERSDIEGLIRRSTRAHEKRIRAMIEQFLANRFRGIVMTHCVSCDSVTPHQHLHDSVDGDPETHMVDSERYTCIRCGLPIHKRDAGGTHLVFILD